MTMHSKRQHDNASKDSGPDMRYEIMRSDTWSVTASAPAHLLIEVADLRSKSGPVPLILRFPGFDPSQHLAKLGDNVIDLSDASSMGRHSHVDAILMLTGGPWTGLDLDPIYGQPTGSHMAEAMEAATQNANDGSGPTVEDLETLSAMHAEVLQKATEDDPILDLVIVRQMRAVPAVKDGQTTNQITMRHEKTARLYRAYGPICRPSRTDRINNLVKDASVYARVQAYNLGFPKNPRPEIRKRSDNC